MFRTSMAISPTPANFGPILFAGDWERGIAAAAELGYDAVEISLRVPWAPVVKEMGQAMRQRGLALSALATGQSYYHDRLSLTSLDPEVGREATRRLQGFVDLAAEWGALVIIGGVRGPLAGDPATHPAQRQRAVENTRSLAEYAQARGVSLALEPINRYETNYLNTIQQTLAFIDEVGGHSSLVVLADSFHMNIEEVSIAGALEACGSRLGHVHFADSNRLAAGQGHIDFHELAGVLRRIGYGGYISAEILPLPDSETAARLAVEAFRSL